MNRNGSVNRTGCGRRHARCYTPEQADVVAMTRGQRKRPRSTPTASRTKLVTSASDVGTMDSRLTPIRAARKSAPVVKVTPLQDLTNYPMASYLNHIKPVSESKFMANQQLQLEKNKAAYADYVALLRGGLGRRSPSFSKARRFFSSLERLERLERFIELERQSIPAEDKNKSALLMDYDAWRRHRYRQRAELELARLKEALVATLPRYRGTAKASADPVLLRHRSASVSTLAAAFSTSEPSSLQYTDTNDVTSSQYIPQRSVSTVELCHSLPCGAGSAGYLRNVRTGEVARLRAHFERHPPPLLVPNMRRNFEVCNCTKVVRSRSLPASARPNVNRSPSPPRAYRTGLPVARSPGYVPPITPPSSRSHSPSRSPSPAILPTKLKLKRKVHMAKVYASDPDVRQLHRLAEKATPTPTQKKFDPTLHQPRSRYTPPPPILPTPPVQRPMPPPSVLRQALLQLRHSRPAGRAY